VIKSKAPISTEELGEQYFLFGPYNEGCVRTEVELLEPHHYVVKAVLEEMRSHGIKVLYYMYTRKEMNAKELYLLCLRVFNSIALTTVLLSPFIISLS